MTQEFAKGAYDAVTDALATLRRHGWDVTVHRGHGVLNGPLLEFVGPHPDGRAYRAIVAREPWTPDGGEGAAPGTQSTPLAPADLCGLIVDSQPERALTLAEAHGHVGEVCQFGRAPDGSPTSCVVAAGRP